MKQINIRNVAEAAGTSIASVSRCLNDKSGVSTPVRRRIVAAAQKLGYDIHFAKRRILALILPTIQVPSLGFYSIQMIDALRTAMAAHNFGCFIISREDIGLLSEVLISGAISFDYLKEVGYEFPNMKNIPLVCLNDIGNHLEQVYHVHSDEEDGISKAMEHLYNNHHTRIGFLYFNEQRSIVGSSYRCQAFRKTAERLAISQSCFIQHQTKDIPAHEAVGMLLQKQCTALIVAGEDMAPPVRRALFVLGKRVPEDISLITAETVQSRFQIPRETTIAQDFPRLAEESIRLLERMIRGDRELGDIAVPYILNIRETVRDLYAQNSTTAPVSIPE